MRVVDVQMPEVPSLEGLSDKNLTQLRALSRDIEKRMNAMRIFRPMLGLRERANERRRALLLAREHVVQEIRRKKRLERDRDEQVSDRILHLVSARFGADAAREILERVVATTGVDLVPEDVACCPLCGREGGG